MRRHLGMAAMLAFSLLLALGGPSVAPRAADSPVTGGAVAVDCSSEPLPEAMPLAPGESLLSGSVYLVKGPVSTIEATFPEPLWQGSFDRSAEGAALVSPSADTPWPPAGAAPIHDLSAPAAVDSDGSHSAWRIGAGWRAPFLMFSPLDRPIAVASLGSFDAGWVILAQALDHLNYLFQGEERHAWFYQIDAQGQERRLHELEIADPARATVVLDAGGEVQIRTHDSTIWWVQCLPPPAVRVTKAADPTELAEPGGAVVFAVRVENTGVVDLTLTELSDDLYGDVSALGNPLLISTTCSLPQALPVGGAYECSFGAAVAGNAGDAITDTVTAHGQDVYGREAEGSAVATVTLTNLLPSIQVTKTPDVNSVPEPGANVLFSIVVRNTSVADPVTIEQVVDDQFGDLSQQCESPLPAVLDLGEELACAFVQFVGTEPGDSHSNVVTASGVDDDGYPVQAEDSATVIVRDLPSAMEVAKRAVPTWIHYPGGEVTFHFSVRNLSTVDTIHVHTLSDSVYGNLDGRGSCSLPQILPPGNIYSCEFTAYVSGEPDTTHTNVVGAGAIDDDGQPLSDQDSAVVTIAPPPTSVDLLSFAARAGDEGIVVEWETAWELENYGFELSRGLGPDAAQAEWLHWELGAGTPFQGQRYQYLDRQATTGQFYYYWLRAIDRSGEVTVYGPVQGLNPHRVTLPLIARGIRTRVPVTPPGGQPGD